MPFMYKACNDYQPRIFVSDYGAARILECERPRNRIRFTFTMFATRNEVYSEFVSEVLDNLMKGIGHGKANFRTEIQYRYG